MGEKKTSDHTDYKFPRETRMKMSMEIMKNTVRVFPATAAITILMSCCCAAGQPTVQIGTTVLPLWMTFVLSDVLEMALRMTPRAGPMRSRMQRTKWQGVVPYRQIQRFQRLPSRPTPTSLARSAATTPLRDDASW